MRKHIEKPVPGYRVERTYKDFERYMENHPEANMVEMDTVEGSKGGPVLLTMLFRNCNFMLVSLLARNTQADVCETFEAMELVLGTETMRDLFEVILTDNGPEFKKTCPAGAKSFWSAPDTYILLRPHGLMAKRPLKPRLLIMPLP